MAKNEKYGIIIGSIAGAVSTRQLLFRTYYKGVIIMKFKNLVMLAAALTCIAGSTVMAEEKVNIKSASADSYEVVQVMTTKDKKYYQYYNSAYQYAVDIPRAATTADMNADGDGCYFQDPKDDAVYMTYAAKNSMGFTIDEL